MQIDAVGKRHLFDHIRTKGYAGTEDDWDAEVQRQNYATAVREFCSAHVRVGLWGHDELQQMLTGWCEMALRRFERVHTSLGGLANGHISFSGRAVSAGRGLRFQQLSIDVRTQGNRTAVRIQGYVAGKLRLDRGFAVAVDWEARDDA